MKLLKRRHFLIAGGGVTAALIVGWGVLPDANARGRLGKAALLNVAPGELALNGWIKISSEGRICLMTPRVEMGQGIHTGLAMLVAEELGVPLAAVQVVTLVPGSAQDRIYGNAAMFEGGSPYPPLAIEAQGFAAKAAVHSLGKIGRNLGLMVTGGSASMADAYEVLRLAGAMCREALKAAAAERLGVPSSAVTLTATGLSAGGATLPYAELARVGVNMARYMPESVTLKAPAQFTLIGTAAPRVDAAAKSRGSAQFGIDVRVPDMVFAAITMCPTLGGSVAALNSTAAQAMPGVISIEQLAGHAGGTAGVAVVARTYWHAKEALAALKISWNDGPNAQFDSAQYLDSLANQCQQKSGFDFMGMHSHGDVDAAFKSASKQVQAEYRAPFLAHATMEPINCTAHLANGKLDVWASTQVPSIARDAAAKAAGVSSSAVTLHTTYLGGGFGRRLEVDFIGQAAQLARQVSPRPVQLIWSREQDTTHDFYRPAQAALLRAALNAQGKVTAWTATSAGAAITPQIARRIWGVPSTGPDKTANEGLFDTPYLFACRSVRHAQVDSPVPVGYWRSVGHSMNAFFSETFIDTVAAAAGQDPLVFRLKHLAHAPSRAAVLQLACDKAGYGKALPAGHAHGVALAESFGSIVAQVAQVSRAAGKIRVHKVTVAIDCGVAVNPGSIAQQMEGGVLFGLTAALYGRIDFKNGQVQQSNFNDYPLLSLADAPLVSTHIINSSRAPGGVGEPGTPPIAPAVANALAKLDGKRQTVLPLV